MAIYKCGRGDETWSAVKQLQIAVRTGLELGTSGFQVRRPNHSATLPPYCHTATLPPLPPDKRTTSKIQASTRFEPMTHDLYDTGAAL